MTLGEPRETGDPWRGRQPKYDKLVMRGPGHFEMITRLPSGERVAVRLAPFSSSTSR